MADPGGRPQGSSFLQVVILIVLGVLLYLVLNLQFTLREIAQEEPMRAMQAMNEEPVLDLGVPAKIVKVDLEKRTLELERKRRTGDRVKTTIVVTDEASILIAGKPGKLEDLKEGINIRYKGSYDEEGLPKAESVTANPPVIGK